MSGGSPYAQKGSSGGSVYAHKGGSGGSVYAGDGGAGSPKKKHGGGGILGTLKRGAHFTASKAGLAAHDIKQIPGGLVDIVTEGGKELANTARHPIVHGEQAAALKKEYSNIAHGHPLRPPPAGSPDAKAAQIVQGQIRAAGTSLRHPLRDPFLTAVTVAPMLHGAGRVSAAARSGDIGALRRPYEPPPRLLKVGDEQVPLHASKNPAVRGAQGVYDKTLQRAIDRNPEGRAAAHATKRAGGSADETARYRQRMREAPGQLLAKSAKKLAPTGGRLPGSKAPRLQRVEQAALELVSVNTSAEKASAYHAAQAEKGVEPARNTALAKLYATVHERGLLTTDKAGNVVVNAAEHPKLAAADKALERVQGLGDETLAKHGVRTPEQLAERVNAPGRVRAGATYEKPTAAKEGKPSQALTRQRAQVSRLQSLHDRASAQAKTAAQESAAALEPKPSPQMIAASRRRLAVLEKKHETAVDKIAAAKYGPTHRADVSYRTKHNKRVDKAQSGVDSLGRVKGSNSAYTGAKRMATAKDEARQAVEREAEQFVEKNPNHPVAKAWRKRTAEIDRLREALNPMPGDAITREALGKEPVAAAVGSRVVTKGKVVGAAGSARAEHLGAALSEAKNRLAQMETAAAKRVKPTGLLGGDQARPGRGFVSYATDEPRAPKNAAAPSPGPVVGETKTPITSKTFTGAGIEHGKVPNDITGQAVRHFHQIVRFVNTTERRNQAIRAGSPVRRTSRDVLVRIPGAEHAKIPAEVEQILGRKKLTHDDVEGLSAALNAYREDLVPGLRDRFSADKQVGIGVAAPEGHVWVDRNVLGDLAKPAPGPRGFIARRVDSINAAVTAATVYFKIGHVGTRVLTNAATNIIQGSAGPVELGRSVTLWKQLSHEDRLRALAAAGQHGFDAMPHEGQGITGRVAGHGAQWWAKHADAPFRFNSLAYEARQAGFKTPAEFKGMLDKIENPEGLDAAQTAKIDWVAKRANRAQIAYDRLNRFERQYITRAVWFYPWIKGATMFAGHTLAEHPYKSAVMGNAGALGREQQQRELGDVPSYEAGLFRLGAGGARPTVADFSTFSPFATPAELLDVAAGHKAPAEFFNPALAGANTLANKLNPYGGPSKNVPADVIAATAGPTSEYQLVNALLHRHDNQANRMFSKTPRSVLERALVGPGMPRRTNLAAQHRAAARERSGTR